MGGSSDLVLSHEYPILVYSCDELWRGVFAGALEMHFDQQRRHHPVPLPEKVSGIREQPDSCEAHETIAGRVGESEHHSGGRC